MGQGAWGNGQGARSKEVVSDQSFIPSFLQTKGPLITTTNIAQYLTDHLYKAF
jgi:hypothetical protein